MIGFGIFPQGCSTQGQNSHCLDFLTPPPFFLSLYLKIMQVEKLNVGEGGVQGITETENKCQDYQILNSHFCCELSGHFSVFRNKLSPVCSLQAQNPVWGQQWEEVRVYPPHGTSSTMGNMGKIYVLFWWAHDLTIGLKKGLLKKHLNFNTECPFLGDSLDFNSGPLCCNLLANWCIGWVSSNRLSVPWSRDDGSCVFKLLPTIFSTRCSIQCKREKYLFIYLFIGE